MRWVIGGILLCVGVYAEFDKQNTPNPNIKCITVCALFFSCTNALHNTSFPHHIALIIIIIIIVGHSLRINSHTAARSIYAGRLCAVAVCCGMVALTLGGPAAEQLSSFVSRLILFKASRSTQARCLSLWGFSLFESECVVDSLWSVMCLPFWIHVVFWIRMLCVIVPLWAILVCRIFVWKQQQREQPHHTMRFITRHRIAHKKTISRQAMRAQTNNTSSVSMRCAG